MSAQRCEPWDGWRREQPRPVNLEGSMFVYGLQYLCCLHVQNKQAVNFFIGALPQVGFFPNLKSIFFSPFLKRSCCGLRWKKWADFSIKTTTDSLLLAANESGTMGQWNESSFDGFNSMHEVKPTMIRLERDQQSWAPTVRMSVKRRERGGYSTGIQRGSYRWMEAKLIHTEMNPWAGDGNCTK